MFLKCKPLVFFSKIEYARGAERYGAGVIPSLVSNDTKTFKFVAGPSRHGSRVFELLTVLIFGPLLAASYSCSSLLFLTWMSGLWVFSVLGVVTILRDEGVKPRVTQHAPSQSGTSPSNRGDQIFSEEIAYYFLSLKFGSEAWVLKKREEQHLEAAQMKFLRHLLGITKLDKEKNQCVREKTGAQSIVKEIKKKYQKKWLQHVQRMDTNRLPKQALQYRLKGRRNTGRPRKRWTDKLHLED